MASRNKRVILIIGIGHNDEGKNFCVNYIHSTFIIQTKILLPRSIIGTLAEFGYPA
jgi:hypothetical protein